MLFFGILYFSLLNISPIKVPVFKFLIKLASLCMPITWIESIFSLNNIIGLPDAPLEVPILWSNSKLLILTIFPLAYSAFFPPGCCIKKIIAFWYI